jgi:hypothetical protein
MHRQSLLATFVLGLVLPCQTRADEKARQQPIQLREQNPKEDLWGNGEPGRPEPLVPIPGETTTGKLASFGLQVDSSALHAGHGTEWRLGGVLEAGTPGPATHGQLWRGWVLRALVGGAYTHVADRSGGVVWLGMRGGWAWVGEIKSADVAFVVSSALNPVLTLLEGGAKRLSVAMQPGVMFRFHTFGITLASPIELAIYGWGDGPWDKGSGPLGDVMVGVQVAVGIWVPGYRW